MAIQVFGQGAVQSAYPSYLKLDIRDTNPGFPERVGSITLVWATSYVDVPYRDPITGIYYQALAATMDVVTAAGNTNTITLPDATKTSIGQTFIIGNVGVSNFSLKKSDGSLLLIVATGIRYWITLTDNSTAVGVWTVITLGAGTSEAIAAELAGYGLIAIDNTLNTNIPTITRNVTFLVDETYRSHFVIWTGGSGMLMALPEITAEDFTDGFEVSVTNQGSGVLTIQPTDPQTISGLTNISIQSQQSLTIISDGTNWQTLGFGQNQLAVDTINNLNVSSIVGSRDLSSVESSSIIQNYTGTLTGNITIYFPIQVNNWFINNNTTVNGFNITIRLKNNGTPIGNSYVLPRGSTEIFFSDSTSLFRSPTALSLINGTETLPALSFSADNSTGIYRTVDGSIGVSVSGDLVAGFTTGQFLAPLATTAAFPAYSFLDGANTGMYYEEEQRIKFSFLGNDIAAFTTDELGTAGSLDIISPGTQKELKFSSFETHGDIKYNDVIAISISSTGIVTLPTAPLSLINGTETLPALSFSADNSTGIYRTVDGSIGVSVGGDLVAGFIKPPDQGMFVVTSPDANQLAFNCSNVGGIISYNDIEAINISATGAVTLPTSPLPIASGGTNAVNDADAINNLMPAAEIGDIVYFNGTNWIVLPIGTPGQVLTVNGAGNGILWDNP